MSQITILSSYLLAAIVLVASRLRRSGPAHSLLDGLAIAIACAGVVLHAVLLWNSVFAENGLNFGLYNVLSLIAWEIAAIALIGLLWSSFRGLGAILLAVASAACAVTLLQAQTTELTPLSIPLQLHVVTSLLAHSLIAVGAVLSVAALAQDRRLKAASTGGLMNLLPPLAAMERLIFTVAIVGFVGLLLSIATGIVFVEDLFAQHLIHKTVLSLIALVLFGTLIIGRALAGWRGRSALYLYLGGFAMLVLAYFGTKFVLEILLERQWG